MSDKSWIVKSLVGLSFHEYEDGKLNCQGAIVGKDGDFYVLEYFSSLDGEPTNLKIIHKERLCENFRFYRTQEKANSVYDIYFRSLKGKL